MVSQVQDLTHLPFAARELMIIKVAGNTSARRDILDIAEDVFRAKTVDVSGHTITLQVIITLPSWVQLPDLGLYILLLVDKSVGFI